MGRATTLFGPSPCGPEEGPKDQISLNFIASKFQRSQIKDTKHIRQDFYLVAWVKALGGTWGSLGSNLSIFSIMLSSPKPLDEIQPNFVCKLLIGMGHATAHIFGPAPWGLKKGAKGKISLFQLQSQFQRILNQTCMSSYT